MAFSLLTLYAVFKENTDICRICLEVDCFHGSALLEFSVHTGPWGREVPAQGTGCVDVVSAVFRGQPSCKLKAEWKQSQGKEKGQDGHKGVGIPVQKHVPNHLLDPQGRAASASPPCARSASAGLPGVTGRLHSTACGVLSPSSLPWGRPQTIADVSVTLSYC